MINKLCKVCVNTCKQDDSAKIVSCPKFQKKSSEKEFLKMINELDTEEIKAKKIQKRVREFISSELPGDSFGPGDSEKNDSENG